jgi:hypothetical protein
LPRRNEIGVSARLLDPMVAVLLKTFNRHFEEPSRLLFVTLLVNLRRLGIVSAGGDVERFRRSLGNRACTIASLCVNGRWSRAVVIRHRQERIYLSG